MNNLLKKMMMALLVLSLSQMAQADNVPHFQETLRAAEQGKAEAQFNLGVMYYNGKVVPQNMAIAKKWFSRACNNGLKKACDIN